MAASKQIASLSGHTGLVRDLALTPDSGWLLSAGWDNTVRSWNLAALT
ncbi:WD40 repeat domain-containing protein [Schlesneria sp. DSM 10557]